MLFVTSIPSISSPKIALGGFITAIIIIGLATGGVKSNVAPLIADQVPKTKPYIKVTKKEKELSLILMLQFNVYSCFLYDGQYWFIIGHCNCSIGITCWILGSLFTSILVFFIAIATLFLGRKKYIKTPVGDRIIAKTFACAWVGIKINLI